MNRLWLIAFVAMALAAAAAPVLRAGASMNTPPAAAAPAWPATFEGKKLTPVPLTPEDSFFTRGFPGHIARFSDGARHIVMRHVSAPTRQLHPATHCFRGAGYAITPEPIRIDAGGAGAACFGAVRGEETLRVCEYIEDDAGRRWLDVSAWYWAALAAPRGLSWWAFVIVERSSPIPTPTDRP